MSEEEVEKIILKQIKVKRIIQNSFSELVNSFDSKFSNFDFQANCFPINDYFGSGSGRASATSKLLADKRIKQNWLREYQTKVGNTKIDFMGLYFFINDKTPFYVGISKGVIGRILQHIKGHSHNTSTLAYNIGLLRYELMNSKKHLGTRKELDFKNEVGPVKKFLSNQQIAFLHIDNYEELYLYEIYCSMRLRTILNKFETY